MPFIDVVAKHNIFEMVQYHFDFQLLFHINYSNLPKMIFENDVAKMKVDTKIRLRRVINLDKKKNHTEKENEKEQPATSAAAPIRMFYLHF